ncbi:hypothetical protein I317_04605 [Kwoniella heveanensis CBS 569]|nr:hypothetical protein I317_04605 [Kwoniella heveanensis CBS 569]
MDPSAFGLPMAFGKQQQPAASTSTSSSSTQLPSKPPAQRGGHTGRESRGNDGRERGRGRGRGGFGQGSGPGEMSIGDGPRNHPAFNNGVKRPDPPSPGDATTSLNQNIPPHHRNQQQSFPASDRGWSDRGRDRGRGRGGGGDGGRGRGRGGGRGGFGGHGSQGDHGGGGGGGFYKDSFAEDPWKELEAQRARQKSG